MCRRVLREQRSGNQIGAFFVGEVAEIGDDDRFGVRNAGAHAQRLGFAEADPRSDVDGIDAAQISKYLSV